MYLHYDTSIVLFLISMDLYNPSGKLMKNLDKQNKILDCLNDNEMLIKLSYFTDVSRLTLNQQLHESSAVC